MYSSQSLDKEARMRLASIIQAKTEDLLFLKTGVEEGNLLQSLEKLDMYDDPEIKKMSHEYMEKTKASMKK